MVMLPKGDFMVVSEAIEFVPQSSFLGTRVIEQVIEPIVKPLLNEDPINQIRWKCYTCYTVLNNNQLVDNKCPSCGEVHLEKMCELDHVHCTHDIVAGLKYCVTCGKPICPVEGCNCHNVFQISRVTGYLANLESFNLGKRAEVRDRVRTNNIESVFR
jgi:hypothetical protein